MTKFNDFRTVNNWQIERQKKFRHTPKQGITINYLEKEFTVFKNVFWPFTDSQVLTKNMKVNPGDSILDVGTGSGVLAIFAANKGAGQVLAVDINPNAVKCAKVNVKKHGFKDIIEVRLSDVYENIKNNEKFDLILANLPCRDKKASDLVEASMWDTNLHAHKALISGAKKHLKEDGKIYLVNANFGPINKIKKIVRDNGLKIEKISEHKLNVNSGEVFYLFCIKP